MSFCCSSEPDQVSELTIPETRSKDNKRTYSTEDSIRGINSLQCDSHQRNPIKEDLISYHNTRKERSTQIHTVRGDEGISDHNTNTYIHTMKGDEGLYLEIPRQQKGLPNIGNSCFMNAVIQCLSHTYGFSDDFYTMTHKFEQKSNPSSEFIPTFSKILIALREDSESNSLRLLLEALKKEISLINPKFKSSGQQDALEFYKLLLEMINSGTNTVYSMQPYKQLSTSPKLSKKAMSEEWYDYGLSRENGKVNEYFSGQIFNQIACMNQSCSYKKWSFDTFWDLSLSFKKQTAKQDAINNLEDMLESFFAKEICKEKTICEVCKKETLSEISSALFRLPTILVLHLKRFKRAEWGGYEKINTDVPLAECIDLGKFVDDENSELKQRAKYNLFGFISHQGSLDFGHYTACCLNPEDNKWYRFNDIDVTKINIEETKLQPYMLFYINQSQSNSTH